MSDTAELPADLSKDPYWRNFRNVVETRERMAKYAACAYPEHSLHGQRAQGEADAFRTILLDIETFMRSHL